MGQAKNKPSDSFNSINIENSWLV